MQSTLWGPRADDWADVQEGMSAALYESVLDTLNVRTRMSVLDIGCGAGLYCRMAADRGASVYGVDATAMLLGIARRRVPLADFRQADMEDLPFSEDSFHVVTAFNVLPFAESPIAALREAKRVARQNAAVVMAVTGMPEQVQTSGYLMALGSLLPVKPASAPGFSLSRDGALQNLARDAGLEPRRMTDVQCVLEYPDEPTALRGLLSCGTAVRAIQAAGDDRVKHVVLKAIAPYRRPDGGYRLTDTYRYLVAKA
ncbi:MAG TPA: methyltransferase domain-containing protein [Thermoanaerobaculia bacterium]